MITTPVGFLGGAYFRCLPQQRGRHAWFSIVVLTYIVALDDASCAPQSKCPMIEKHLIECTSTIVEPSTERDRVATHREAKLARLEGEARGSSGGQVRLMF
jgi:hypothetical protein